MKALVGKLVVALEQAVAAPFCTARMADAGARVIKIERPGVGDFARHYDTVAAGQSAYFVWVNRGKESLELDIKNPDDLALLHNILAQADVFIQNLAPGATKKIGLGTADLLAKYPRLVVCDISGYGEDGPYQQMKAYDLLVQAESGLAAITGAEDAPGRVGVSVCDIAAGMNALSGILLALLEREKTGKGQSVKISLFDGMADWMTVPLLHHDYGGQAPARVGLKHPSIAPYGVYETATGTQILISIQNEREWQSFCTEILALPDLARQPEYANNSQRVRNRAVLDRLIEDRLVQYDTDELTEKLRHGRIAFGRLNDVSGLSTHSQLRRKQTDTETGAVNLVASPVRFDGEDMSFGKVPALGAHNQTIRAEFHKAGDGYDRNC